MPLEWWIAGRYLRSRRASRFVSLTTLFATLGVTLGVAAMYTGVGVVSALQTDMRERILGANPHLRVLTYGEGLRLDDWEHALAVVRRQPEVLAAAPFVLSQGLVSAGHDYAEGVAVIGIEPDTGRMAVTSIARSFTAGDLRFATRLDSVDGGVVLGRRLADRLSAFPGSIVTVISPAGSQFNRAIGAFVPRYWRFEVTGVFETGMYEYDNTYVLMPRALAQRFAGLDRAVSGLEVRVRDPWHADRVARALEDTLAFPYRALDWQAQNASLFSALKLEKAIMSFVLALVVIVAAFNIVSTLTMTVADRTKEVGILRAMGMTATQVQRIFRLQGLVIGAVGTVLGLGVGLLLRFGQDRYQWFRLDPSVYFIERVRVETGALDVALIAATSMAIAWVATILPSRRAAALDPVDAIRFE